MTVFVPLFLSHVQLTALSTWLFFYLAFVIGSSMNLSSADIRGAQSGFTVLVIVNIIASILFLVHLTESVAKFSTMYSFFYSIMALAVFLLL